MTNKHDRGFEVYETQNDEKNTEAQSSGKIDDLPRYEEELKRRGQDGSGRTFVAKTVVGTACLIAIMVLGWGTITGDFIPYQQAEGFINLVIGGVVGYYFKSG